MQLVNGIPDNKFFESTTGINPDFREYKVNNYQALRAMIEIINFKGDINDPNFNPIVKKWLNNNQIAFADAKNSKSLAFKLNKFAEHYDDLQKNPIIRQHVSDTVNHIFEGWDTKDFTKAISLYSDRESCPLYINVDKYLSCIITERGDLVTPSKSQIDALSEYSALTMYMRSEIDAQYAEYKKKDTENE